MRRMKISDLPFTIIWFTIMFAYQMTKLSKNTGDLQIVFGTNYEQNKFLNSTSSGVFSTGDLSNTNFAIE